MGRREKRDKKGREIESDVIVEDFGVLECLRNSLSMFVPEK